MDRQKIDLPYRKCSRCQYEWVPRKEYVRICPKCKSPYWDIPRREGLHEKV